MKKYIFFTIAMFFSISFLEIHSQLTPIDPDGNTTWYRDADGDGFGNPRSSIQSSTQPNGYVLNNTDCDDSDPNIKAERFWYRDSDGDGYGSSSNKTLACSAPSGYVSNSSDCNDSNASLPKYFYKDNDGDGYGTSSNKLLACSAPSGYVSNTSDCNDSNASLPKYWYVDSDEDGYGAGIGILDCSQPALTNPDGPVTYSNINGDCNDNNPNIKPGALEICDGIDNDCDGQIDEAPKPDTPDTPSIKKNCGNTVLTRGIPPIGITWYWQSSSSGTSISNSNISITRTSGTTYYLRAYNTSTKCWSDVKTISYTINIPSIWYADQDGDGYGDANNTISTCETPSGYVSNNNDYDDSTTNITNIAPQTFYLDADNDGFGDPNNSVYYSVKPAGYTTNNDDYDDSTVNITNIAPQTFYLDADGDGFGDPNNSVYYSVKPAGYVTNNTDNCPNEAGTNNGCSYTPPVFSNENYVFTRAYKEPMTNPTGIMQNKDVLESITYFDGLGRAKQSIAIQAGGILTNNEEPKDIVTHVEYDEFGRQTKEYLPYAVESANGTIITGDVASATKSFYQVNYSDDFTGVNLPDINAYSEKQFDGSPLNRVLKQAAPGKDWKLGNGHEIEFVYDTNIATEVKNYYVTTSFADNTYTPTLELSTVNNGNYLAQELFKTVTKDENHDGSTSKLRTTEEFKNKQGQVLLKRTYALVSGIETAHDTYYVYDDFGNLTYVLPPKVEAQTDKPTLTELNELCYQYKYDYRNRLVEKKIPGKGWEYIVYDKLDRPVLTQDAMMRRANSNSSMDKWLFTKYDALGKVVYTGYIDNNSIRTVLQNAANSTSYTQFEIITSKQTYGGADIYYTKTAIPKGVTGVYTINYYDTYIDLPDGLEQTVTTSYGTTSTSRTKGLATVSKVRVLGTNNWITTVTYYDKKARPIYVYSKNDELGTIDIVESKLDFSGKVLETKTTHKKSGKADIVTIDSFEYDHVGRMTKQTQKINAQATETIVANEYDELGQLKTKKVGGTLQEVDYTYNVRGWLKNINEDGKNDKDLFNFTLVYENPTDPLKALYNGNISQINWNTLSINNTSNPVSSQYEYTYDALNRITAATSDAGGNYNLSGITYDKNGNILTLQRRGHTQLDGNGNVTGFGLMDNLKYDYNETNVGNKLVKVQELTGGSPTYGFKDGTNTNNDFEYDQNGNMIVDRNKGITGITYNHLNLPVNVTLAGGTINYTYDAAGNKLRKVANSTTTDYAGGFKYVNGTLQFFNHAEGYVSPKNTNDISQGFKYVYQYKDHLGNVRLSYSDNNNDGVITPSTEIIEESNYYPFGLEHKGYNGNISSLGNSVAQKFGYNDKELEEELGKNTLAYGWRDYDPAIGRFNKIDRFAEKYQNLSTYSYAANNPIKFVDVQGDSIAGVNRKSARRARRLMRKTFRKNRKIARLFKTKGNGFKKISDKEFTRATKGASKEQIALATAYTMTINSDDVHMVEVVKSGEKMSKFSQKNTVLAFSKDKNGSVLNQFGGGLNSGLRKKVGTSYSAILLDSSPIPHVDELTNNTVLQIENAASALAHELLGHGYGRSINSSGFKEVDAMQMGNLSSRVQGNSRYQRNQHSEGSSILTKNQYSGIPTHF